ncbi:PaaI family thioesterase [Leptospira adleri]|uniref:Aminoglycoside phosphotransferase n=1 Tax=Leptospira adleri TaxID=2023186 RepID=A0A2M9YKY6_9LEPT|nr:PaaI family thioesterase [Leptospira adleri]PJZ52140.1 aminoglycoside phosphotransferase [Leptospira adleri]PJZ62986.1 aminoglycoside phosphotransferase [Leptospira adleri]
MTVAELLNHNVPADIFTLKENCSLIEQAQNLIDQCHPGATKMKVLEVTSEISEAEIPYSQSNRALHGFMHGGCFFSVGDTLTSLMAFFHVQNEKERTLTMDASIRYLRPVRTDTVRAKARLVRKDGKLLEYVCDFFNEENKRAAQAKYRYAIAEPR